jgi:hypothetical protein
MGFIGKALAPFHQAKWILLSSIAFIFPAIYAFKNNLFILSGTTAIACICSINHWRNPRYGIIRNIDIFTAYSSGLTYTIYTYTHSSPLILPYMLFMSISIFGSYKYSDNIHRLYPDKSYWVKYHMLFHFNAIVAQYMSVYVIKNNDNFIKFITFT